MSIERIRPKQVTVSVSEGEFVFVARPPGRHPIVASGQALDDALELRELWRPAGFEVDELEEALRPPTSFAEARPRVKPGDRVRHRTETDLGGGTVLWSTSSDRVGSIGMAEARTS
jgi:hypothetical protein